MTNQIASPGRIASIDIFRALTMTLMIFVNDLWTLSGIPQWLLHTPADYDGMGLSDVVFPAFLFIVGLSIPHAIDNRRKKAEKDLKILGHILLRSLALITMGFFLVNFENISRGSLPILPEIYEILLIVAFFLIWTKYPSEKIKAIPVSFLQGAGVVLLVALAAIYKGAGEELPWMKIHWWGILGLIGWAYLFSALVCFLSKGRLPWIIAALAAVMLLNLQEVLAGGSGFKLIVSASNHFLVMAGVLASTIFRKTHSHAGTPDPLALHKGNERLMAAFPGGKGKTEGSQETDGPGNPGGSGNGVAVSALSAEGSGTAAKKYRSYFLVLMALGAAALIYGFLVRPLGGISKIHATPSWTMICAGISLMVLALLYFLTDRLKITSWARIIAPAGRSTLTCYLIPYVVYPLLSLLHFKLPAALTTGPMGLLKSLLFALLIVVLTRLMEKLRITLKI